MKQIWKKAAACLLSMALFAGVMPVYTGRTADSIITAEAVIAEKFVTFEIEIHGVYDINDSPQIMSDGQGIIQLTSTKGNNNGVDIGRLGELQIDALNGKNITKVKMTCSYVYDEYQNADFDVLASSGSVTREEPFGVGKTVTVTDINSPSVRISTDCPAHLSYTYVPGSIIFDVVTVYYEGDDVPVFSDASLSLADDLVMNFYAGEEITADNYQDYTIEFEGGCDDTEGVFLYNAEKDMYYTPAHICAKNIRQEITAYICKDGKRLSHATYSAEKYLKKIINPLVTKYQEGTLTESETKTLGLASATLGYGYTSDMYFGVSSDLDESTFKPFVQMGMITLGITNYKDLYDKVNDYIFHDEDTLLSLVLDSKTAARLYVRGIQPGGKAYASSVESTKADFPSYYQIKGILPQDLGKKQTITDANGKSYSFSALSWAYRVIFAKYNEHKDIPDNDLRMVEALLTYGLTAADYVQAMN